MTPILRFRLWAVCVIGIWVAAPVAARPVDFQKTTASIALALYLAFYVGLVALLRSTPADAIRLSPQRSVAWITAGSGWLYLASFAAAFGIETGIAMGLVAAALAFGFSRLLVARHKPAWSAAVILWCPLFVVTLGFPMLAVIEFASIGLVLLTFYARHPR